MTPPRSVTFQPAAQRRFARGVAQIVGALRPTLGPRPRLVAVDTGVAGKPPELLDVGGTIARRIVELPHPDEDMGAMWVRGMLWRLQEQVGDGTATAATLFGAVYAGGVRHLAAGGAAMALRQQLERGLALLLAELDAQTLPISGQERLARLAESLCYDAPLAGLLGEIFDIIGAQGRLDLRAGRGRGLEREYVEGLFWSSGTLSPYFLPQQVPARVQLERAALLVSDLEITDGRELVPLLEQARRNALPALVLVAKKLSDSAISVLLTNRQPGSFELVAVKTPGHTLQEQADALADMAAASGARALIGAAGDTLARIAPGDLGSARRAWADRDFFGIVGGGGNPRAFRAHLRTLRAAFAASTPSPARTLLQERIGRLMGGSATLWVGGTTEPELEARKERATRTAAVLRAAVADGVLPGGGTALLNCRPALRHALECAGNNDEHAAYRILLTALEAPTRTIIANAGHDPSATLGLITRTGPGYGFDARAECVVDMAQAGILDAAAVLKAALRTAVTSAALALTVDAHVHTRRDTAAQSPEG